MANFIPLSIPNFCGNEKKYVDDALEGAWVSTSGAKVGDMEKAVADYVHMPRAVAANSGTSALHLSAMAVGIRRGDEVLVPALTFIAAVNPVTRYIGAEPVFIGCDDSLCMNPAAAEDFCANHCTLRADGLYNNKTGARVAAIMVVHVFGNMADMPAFRRIAAKYHLVLMEDATEALGTYYTEGELAGKFAGTMGDTGRRIAVLGSMLELGDYTEEGHRRAGRAAAEHADVLYAYGPSADAIARGAEEKGMTAVHAFTDQNELVEKLRADAKPGDALLFKGSRGMRMERALALFLGEEVE